MTTVEVPEFKMDPSAAKMVQSLLTAATEIAATDTDDLALDTKRLQETVSQLQNDLAGIRKHVTWVRYQPVNDSSDRLPDLLSNIDLETVIDENGVIAAAEQAKRMAAYLTGLYARNLERGDILQPLAKAALYLSAHLMRVDNYLRGANPNSLARQYEPSGGGPPPPPVAPPSNEGDNGGMEKRIDALEKDMRDVRDRLARVEVKVDGLESKVDKLPSKDFVTSAISSSSTKIILWVVAAVGAAQLIPSVAVPLLRHFGIGS